AGGLALLIYLDVAVHASAVAELGRDGDEDGGEVGVDRSGVGGFAFGVLDAFFDGALVVGSAGHQVDEEGAALGVLMGLALPGLEAELGEALLEGAVDPAAEAA